MTHTAPMLACVECGDAAPILPDGAQTAGAGSPVPALSGPVYTVDLAWPNGTLFPNSRAHRMVKAKHVRAARNAARWACRAAGVGPILDARARVEVTFFPPSRRGDTDNMVAACKAHFDGVADEIGVDDARWTWVFERGEPVKGGCVRVRIEGIPA